MESQSIDRARAEKAERERDEARTTISILRVHRDELRAEVERLKETLQEAVGRLWAGEQKILSTVEDSAAFGWAAQSNDAAREHERRAALEWYADRENYEKLMPVLTDNGRRARAALGVEE